MRVICSVLVLACLGSAHAEVEDSGALGASELSAASVAELETKRTQAEQANDALAILLEGVTSTGAPSETVKTEQSEAPGSSRSSEPRADEQAVAEIPAKAEQDLRPQAFQNIRTQLAQMSVADGQTLIAGFLEDHPTHREARITLARLQVLDNDPASALLTLDSLVASVADKIIRIGNRGSGLAPLILPWVKLNQHVVCWMLLSPKKVRLLRSGCSLPF